MKARQRRMSKNNRRFLSAADMRVIVTDITVRNSKIKRGEVIPKGENHYIVQCGCGATGCCVHSSFESYPGMQTFPK